MNFIEWTTEQESKEPIPSNPKNIKTKHERERLTRMEAMLDELLLLKQVIVEARTFTYRRATMPARTDLDHALQLRLSKNTVAEIDEVIANVPQLCGFSRCKFIRAAVLYALDSLEEDGHLRNGCSAVTKENEQ